MLDFYSFLFLRGSFPPLIVDKHAQRVAEEGKQDCPDYQTTTFACDDAGRARHARVMSDYCNKKRKQSSANNFLGRSVL